MCPSKHQDLVEDRAVGHLGAAMERVRVRV